jgi:uncharacterized protein YgbK (DUF1537 family)
MDSSEKIIVLDALKPQHFRNIAKAIQLGGNECFTFMATRLARELPFIYGYSIKNRQEIDPLKNEKPVLVVIGSYENTVERQLYKAKEEIGLPIIDLESTGLLSRKSRRNIMGKYSDRIISILNTGYNCAITSIHCKFIPQLRYKMAYLLAEIAAEAFSQCDLGALLTAGSDTTYAVCDMLKVKEIEVLGNSTAGVSTIISKLNMSNGYTLSMGSRGGVVGGDDEIYNALNILRPLQSTQ